MRKFGGENAKLNFDVQKNNHSNTVILQGIMIVMCQKSCKIYQPVITQVGVVHCSLVVVCEGGGAGERELVLVKLTTFLA